MPSFTTLTKKITEAPRIDFGDLFNESVAVFKKVWLQGFILQLISIVLSLPLIIFNFSFLLDSGLDSNSYEPLEQLMYSDTILEQSGPMILLYYLMVIVVGFMSSLLSFGFFRVIRQMDEGAPFEISNFFYFFNAARIKKSLLLILANFGIAILALLMCVFPIFYVMIPLMFVTPMFVYNPELSISEILKSSFSLGHKKWGITFAITILNVITLYILILLTCGLGSLFFSCFLQMPIYVLYKKIISFEDSSIQQ
ncbi:MAG: hypothetical protein ACPF88_02845 [Flavobacteriaceae bacterium]